MPSSLSNDDIVQFTAVSSFGNQIGLFTWHYKMSGLVGTMTDQDLLDQFIASVTVIPLRLRATMSDEARYDGMMAQKIWPARFAAVQNLTDAGLGAEVNSGLPRQVSGIITKQTPVATRHGRGRVYIPFPSSTFLSPSGDNTDIPTAAYMPFLADIGTDICSGFTAIVGANNIAATPIVFNRANPLLSLNITGSRPNRKWATQRRRGDYGAPNSPLL